MVLVGYMRVSTAEQNLALQRDALNRQAANIYMRTPAAAPLSTSLTEALDHQVR